MQQTAQPDGGVVVSIGRAAETGDSLAEDVVTQMSATYGFKANVLTLKTQDRMLGMRARPDGLKVFQRSAASAGRKKG